MPQRIYLDNEKDRVWTDGRPDVMNYVRSLKEQNPNFTLIDLGASWNPFNREFLTHTFDLNPAITFPGVKSFIGNLNDYEDWKQLFDYVEEHGKFDFCNCTHTLEDVAYPEAALKYMPRIAKEGFIAVPAKYWELQRRDAMRGGHHHRWIFDNQENVLVGYPKINLIEYMSIYSQNENEINEKSYLELRMFWKDDINYQIINNDYLGPSFEDVINMYHGLL